MFPILIGHTNALGLAVDHALSAVDATIYMIFHYILFGSPIQNDQFNSIGGTILDT
ncbi:MAG TPA: hypothetical protein VF896_18070 [Anaerolineales bacterium]